MEVLEMKIILNDIYSNFDTTYKQRKFENAAINLLRIKHRGEKFKKKNEQGIRDPQKIIRWSNIHVIGVPENRGR